VELSPADAKKLGIADGDRVEVGSNGTRVRGAVRLRDAVPKGSVFLADGTPQEPANTLTDPLVEIARVGGPDGGASATGARVEPAAAGAEMQPSAPLAIPPTGPSQSGHEA
jgi:anaerobic selenocysteine-containing dehydrogenase